MMNLDNIDPEGVAPITQVFGSVNAHLSVLTVALGVLVGNLMTGVIGGIVYFVVAAV